MALQDKVVRAASVRGGHVGRGLNRVRASCVDVLGRVFQAQGRSRARRRPCGRAESWGEIVGDDGGQSGWGWMTQGPTGRGAGLGLSLCMKWGAQEDLSRVGTGSRLMLYNAHSGCWMENGLEGSQGKPGDPQRDPPSMIQVREDGGWTRAVAEGAGVCFRHSRQDIFPSLVSFLSGARQLMVKNSYSGISLILCLPLSVIWGKWHNLSVP